MARCLSVSTSVTLAPVKRFSAFWPHDFLGSMSLSAEVTNRVSGEFAITWLRSWGSSSFQSRPRVLAAVGALRSDSRRWVWNWVSNNCSSGALMSQCCQGLVGEAGVWFFFPRVS